MNLQNGYKVIYEKASDNTRAFYASMSGVFADAEKIAEVAMGEYKLIYEKDGQFYGSTSGIPTESDHCFVEFDKVFKAVEETPNTNVEDEEVPVVEPEQEVTTEDEPVEEVTDETEE